MLIGSVLSEHQAGLRFKDRNFFGIARVWDDSNEQARFFMHDTTVHGVQSLRPDEQDYVTSYYPALADIFPLLTTPHTNIAAIGLGVGTSKCLLRANQQIDFFEINPMVISIAQNPDLFTFLNHCPGSYRIILGDGRLKIGEQPQHRYDLLVLDAFSSDAIPTHLLTREAMAIYFEKLKPNGVIALHVTNRHINLSPIIAAGAKAFGAVAYQKHFTYPVDARLQYRSDWIILAKDESALAPILHMVTGWEALPDSSSRVWTDQYVSILPHLKMFNK